MTTAKKAATVKVATPSPEADRLATGLETASAAPSVDPGPPPRMPAWPGSVPVGSIQDRLRTAAHQRDRDILMAVDAFRQPPEVQQYKAELLGWLEAVAAYELAHGH